MPAVGVERQGEIAVVRLNRPERLNAVNRAMREALPALLRELEADPALGAVVLAGAGERAFCAGQDVEEAAAYTEDEVDAWVAGLHAMYGAVRAMNKPTVAALVGVAAGAGYQIALYCDLRVGHPELRIGQPEVKAGLGSVLGTSQMMWHLPLSMNAELSLTGELMSGERAYQLGVLNRLAAREAVLATAIEAAKSLASRPPTAIRLTKERIRELTQPQFEETLAAAKRYQKRAYASGEPQRLMRRFISQRKS